MASTDQFVVTRAELEAVANAIRTKGGTQADLEWYSDFVSAIGAIPTGTTPTGNINITNMQQTDVSAYATAQVVDADLVAGNIKKNVNILGVTGTYEGSGGVGDEYLKLNCVADTPFTIGGVSFGSTGAVFSGGTNNLRLSPTPANDITIEIDVASMQLQSGANKRFVMKTYNYGLIYRSTGYWGLYNGSWEMSTLSDLNLFDNSTVKIYIDDTNSWHIYKNGVLIWEPTRTLSVDSLYIGSSDGSSIDGTTITEVRLYVGEKQ